MNCASALVAATFAVMLAGCPGETVNTSVTTEMPPDPGPPCESARVLKIRTVERAEGRVGGPAPATEDDAAGIPRGISGAIYYISLDCGGKAYIARVSGGTPGFDPDELAAAASVHLRWEDGKVFLQSEHGAEFEAILATLPSPRAAPPR